MSSSHAKNHPQKPTLRRARPKPKPKLVPLTPEQHRAKHQASRDGFFVLIEGDTWTLFDQVTGRPAGTYNAREHRVWIGGRPQAASDFGAALDLIRQGAGPG